MFQSGITHFSQEHMRRTNKKGSRAGDEGDNRDGSQDRGGVSRGRTPDETEMRETLNQSRDRRSSEHCIGGSGEGGFER